MKRLIKRNCDASVRNGLLAVDMVLSLTVSFVFAMGMYWLAQSASVRLHHFISTMVGSLYL